MAVLPGDEAPESIIARQQGEIERLRRELARAQVVPGGTPLVSSRHTSNTPAPSTHPSHALGGAASAYAGVGTEPELEALREELARKAQTVADVEAAVEARAELRASLQREAEELRRDSEGLRRQLSSLRVGSALEQDIEEEVQRRVEAERRCEQLMRQQREMEEQHAAELQVLDQGAQEGQSELDCERDALHTEYTARLRDAREDAVAELEGAKAEILGRFEAERAKLRSRVNYLEKAIERKQRDVEEWHEKNVAAAAHLQRAKDAQTRARDTAKARAEQLRGQADRGDKLASRYEAELRAKEEEVERLRRELHQRLSFSDSAPSVTATPHTARRRGAPTPFR
eukprot:Hpha_TRINITY_DN14943_c3_g4::TRINITY_DN14943_c3_g4_i1::g.143116::m.143116